MTFQQWKKQSLSKMGNNHPDLEQIGVPKEYADEPEVLEVYPSLKDRDKEHLPTLLPVSLYPDGILRKAYYV